jgi:hypothetical protein
MEPVGILDEPLVLGGLGPLLHVVQGCLGNGLRPDEDLYAPRLGQFSEQHEVVGQQLICTRFDQVSEIFLGEVIENVECPWVGLVADPEHIVPDPDSVEAVPRLRQIGSDGFDLSAHKNFPAPSPCIT